MMGGVANVIVLFPFPCLGGTLNHVASSSVVQTSLVAGRPILNLNRPTPTRRLLPGIIARYHKDVGCIYVFTISRTV